LEFVAVDAAGEKQAVTTGLTLPAG